ncbi:ATP-binding protein [Fodinicola acaciae]|uniref:ATP-binding protein n=1 Tax=Fodinicola acaciae TaxID=2681555 RepID=UPI0013D2F70D|nr:ATP-binding protein [Fodinicola acaciae]
MVSDLYHRVPALAGELPALRHELAAWSGSAGLSPQAAQVIVLASYEAMANVVDHAYRNVRGALELRAVCEPDGGSGAAVNITVTDFGRWRPLPADPGVRGRGLLLMRRLATRTDIDATERGTTVTLWWSADSLKTLSI